MISSQTRVNDLLKIFDKPKNITPYNIINQKEEIENNTKFTYGYHKNDTTKYYQNPISIVNHSIHETEYITKNKPLIDQNTPINGKSKILSNNINNLENYEDIDIYKSITDLKNGQKEFIKNKEAKNSQNINNIYPKYSIYPKFNPDTQSISAYEYQKNENILNSILGNSSNLSSTQYLYDNDYGQNYTNNYNCYNDYTSTYNINSSRLKIMNYKKPKSLKDIPSHPEDVIIKDIPSYLAISMNPISSSNLGAIGQLPITNFQSDIGQIPQDLNQKPSIIEEINTDIIPNNNVGQIKQKEEPVLLDSLEPVKEPEEVIVREEIKPNGQFKITEFNGPVKLPQNYSTADEDEFNAIQILNQDKSSWKLQIDKDNMKVYSKLYKIIDEKGKEDDNIMFYTEATLNFPASEINKQLYTYSLREKWEKSLQKGKLIKDENLPHNLQITEYYSFIKMPLLFSDRDMVLRKKVWKDYQGEKDCTLSHLKSIEHPDFPAKKKPVRAEYENRGEYVKPINENQCKLYMATKFNLKVSAPVSMMEGKGSDSQAKWVKEFISHCGK